MLKNITFGQFYPADSFIHHLDPRIKIILTVAMVVLVFMGVFMIDYILIFLFFILCARLSSVPLKLLIKGLKPLRFILLLTFVLNLCFSQGDKLIVDLSFVKITEEGFVLAVRYSLRLMFLVIATSYMTLTTSPISLADGIEMLLSPLKIIRFPAHEFAMMMTITLRFIPTLLEETDKIMKAQMARGADFESGNILKRAKAMVPLMVPLFVSAFKRATELAMAMESRCYHGGINRTRLRTLTITKNDLYACLSVAALISIKLFMNMMI